MDITEIIQHQHDEQRRAFAVLEEWPRDDVEGLRALWGRLAIFLENHAEAEERYFYPEVLKLGTGGGDAESLDEEVEDAVHDHNEIRDAVRRAQALEVGSDEWWTAVVDANVQNSEHMGEEERQDLADFRQQASLELRHEIAIAFLRYEAQHAGDEVDPVDKDPEGYLREHEKDGVSDLARAAAADAERATTPDRRIGDEPSKTASDDSEG